MEQSRVIEFFDSLAPVWDEQTIRNDEIIDIIFSNAQITKGNDVLDVACGTGVVIPDYIKRGVKSITAIDISPQMIKLAKSKFADVNFICANAQEYDFEKKFDNIMIFNAFPHFSDSEGLIARLCTFLKKGGTITVAHNMSREKINAHHKGAASEVSVGLLPSNELSEIFIKNNLQLVTAVSNDEMYQVTGRRE